MVLELGQSGRGLNQHAAQRKEMAVLKCGRGEVGRVLGEGRPEEGCMEEGDWGGGYRTPSLKVGRVGVLKS